MLRDNKDSHSTIFVPVCLVVCCRTCIIIDDASMCYKYVYLDTRSTLIILDSDKPGDPCMG